MKTSKGKVGDKTLPVFGVTQAEDGSLVIVMKAKVPSWNALMAMHWRHRHKLKGEIQESLLSALSRSAEPCSMKIIWLKNSIVTHLDTLRSFLGTRLIKRQSKSRRSKSKQRKRNTPAS